MIHFRFLNEYWKKKKNLGAVSEMIEVIHFG